MGSPVHFPPGKRHFTEAEDKVICAKVAELGEDSWCAIADALPHRNARQCRERWRQYLRTGISAAPWTEAEERILIHQHHTLGRTWAQMRGCLPGRTDVAIKNRWSLIVRNLRNHPLPRIVRPPAPPQQFAVEQEMRDPFESPLWGLQPEEIWDAY
jgi:hypothetical protein